MIHYFFQNFREANDWLAFDCPNQEAEYSGYVTPDQYAEWAELFNRWQALGEPDLDGPMGAQRA